MTKQVYLTMSDPNTNTIITTDTLENFLLNNEDDEDIVTSLLAIQNGDLDSTLVPTGQGFFLLTKKD